MCSKVRESEKIKTAEKIALINKCIGGLSDIDAIGCISMKWLTTAIDLLKEYRAILQDEELKQIALDAADREWQRLHPKQEIPRKIVKLCDEE